MVVEFGEEGAVVALRVFDEPARARDAHAVACARLLAGALREAVEHHVAYDPQCEALLGLLGHAGEEDGVGFVARLVAATVQAELPRVPRAAAEAIEAERRAGSGLHDRVAFVMRLLMALLGAVEEIEARVRGVAPHADGEPKARVAARLREVVGGHGLTALEGCSRDGLAQRLRLAQMLMARLERLREIGASRDRAIDDELAPLRARVITALRERSRPLASIDAIRSMWEEIEISRFAPKLPRAFPASERRLEELLGP